MQVNNNNIVINNESIPWGHVKNIRLANDKLFVVLSGGTVVEVDNLNPSIVDAAFRAYEAYLRSQSISD